MIDQIKLMLDRYDISDTQSQKNAFHEVIQEIVLLGLSRSDFFRKAAFYGGTALRVFYQLDRFSEDLDFTLMHPEAFDLSSYRKNIEQTLASYGLEFEFQEKKKGTFSPIESAFIKGNTNMNLVTIGILNSQHRDAKTKIKIEVDTQPALGFQTESKLYLRPTSFYVQTLDPPSLFAGKLHALLFRERSHNVKGRDWFDFVWYLQQGTPYNFTYLQQKIQQSFANNKKPSIDWSPEGLSEDSIREGLQKRIALLDCEAAKRDVSPFIKDETTLELWNQNFFMDLLPHLKAHKPGGTTPGC